MNFEQYLVIIRSQHAHLLIKATIVSINDSISIFLSFQSGDRHFYLENSESNFLQRILLQPVYKVDIQDSDVDPLEFLKKMFLIEIESWSEITFEKFRKNKAGMGDVNFPKKNTIIKFSQIEPPKNNAFVSEDSEIYDKTKYFTVPVLFATDREVAGDTSEISSYSKERTNVISYGSCNVSIPYIHKAGRLERPSFWNNLYSENPEKHFTIQDVSGLDFENLTKQIKDKIGMNGIEDILIFVHGYNVGFKDSVLRAGQLAFDVAFEGSVIAFSWASQKEFKGYVEDMDSADHATHHLKRFLINLIEKGFKKLNIIAHSMGNRVVTNCLREIKSAHSIPSGTFNHIIMAAPDLDRILFEEIVGPEIAKIGNSITLYAASNDKAMHFSNLIRNQAPRLGSSKKISIIPGIDTVDATKVNVNGMYHGYFSDTKDLLNDIFMILKHSHPPEKRLLSMKTIPAGIYWEFRA